MERTKKNIFLAFLGLSFVFWIFLVSTTILRFYIEHESLPDLNYVVGSMIFMGLVTVFGATVGYYSATQRINQSQVRSLVYGVTGMGFLVLAYLIFWVQGKIEMIPYLVIGGIGLVCFSLVRLLWLGRKR